MTKIRDEINVSLIAGPDETSKEFDEIVLMLKAKQRYRGVELGENNPQVIALNRMIALLISEEIPAILFYATESPEDIRKIVRHTKHSQNLEQLADIIGKAADQSRITYLGPDTDVTPEMFLDHVHVNSQGYERLAERLWIHIPELLNL
jgi:lysophospholipase L1-like esterase